MSRERQGLILIAKIACYRLVLLVGAFSNAQSGGNEAIRGTFLEDQLTQHMVLLAGAFSNAQSGGNEAIRGTFLEGQLTQLWCYWREFENAPANSTTRL